MLVHGWRGQRVVIRVDDLLGLPIFEPVAWAAFVAYGKGGGLPAGLKVRRRVQLGAREGAWFAAVMQGRRYLPEGHCERTDGGSLNSRCASIDSLRPPNIAAVMAALT